MICSRARLRPCQRPGAACAASPIVIAGRTLRCGASQAPCRPGSQ
jgi:hypothetical protein